MYDKYVKRILCTNENQIMKRTNVLAKYSLKELQTQNDGRCKYVKGYLHISQGNLLKRQTFFWTDLHKRKNGRLMHWQPRLLHHHLHMRVCVWVCHVSVFRLRKHCGGTWRANQRDMLTNKPCRTVRPPSNTLQCARWTWTALQRSYAWNEQHEGSHAQNAASVEGLDNVCENGRYRSGGKARPPSALSGCGYYTCNVRPVISRFFFVEVFAQQTLNHQSQRRDSEPRDSKRQRNTMLDFA